MMAAAAQRERSEREFVAAMTANQLNCWTKKPVTVQDLLGGKVKRRVRRKPRRLEDIPIAEMTDDQRQRVLRVISERAAKRGNN